MHTGFWILQTHRKQYDPDRHATVVGAENLWAVWNRPEESIARGDKVALYVMGNRKGIFAFGEVISDVRPLNKSELAGSPAAVTERGRFQAEHAIRIRYERILRRTISFTDIKDKFGSDFKFVSNVQMLNYEITRNQWDNLIAMRRTS